MCPMAEDDIPDPTPDTSILMAQHAYFRLGAATLGIIDKIRTAIRSWPDEAKRPGAKARGISLMGAVINPDR